MLEEFPETLYALAWHNSNYSPGGSDLPIPEYGSRGSLYGVGGIPHCQWQGVQETVGGYPNGNWTPMYNSFIPIYNTYIVNPMDYDILLYGGVDGSTVSWNVQITRNDNASDGSVTAYVFVWEDSISGYWSGASQNGISQFVVRDQLDQQTYTFTNSGDTESMEGSFEILGNWTQDMLGITVVVQNTSDHKVIGVTKSNLDGLVIDTDEDGVFNFEDNCPDDFNPDQGDIDLDGIGDVCDACDNANVYVVGNVTGDVYNNAPIIDIYDVLLLVDLVLENDYPGCTIESANFNGDNFINVLDIVQLAQYVMGYNGNRTATSSGNVKVSVVSHDGIMASEISISSDEFIAGIQFEIPFGESVANSLDHISLPDGWILNYAVDENIIRVLAVDISGSNSQNSLEFSMNEFSGFSSIIVSDRNGGSIPVVIDAFEQPAEIGIPVSATLQDLYPNPFNPQVNVPFTLPFQMDVRISVYNVNGQLVDVLLDQSEMVSGAHRISWDATHHASGVYFIRIQTPQGIDTRKAFLLK